MCLIKKDIKMDFKSKENKFKELTKKTKQNRYLIALLKKVIVSLILVFITISFVSFYINCG